MTQSFLKQFPHHGLSEAEVWKSIQKHKPITLKNGTQILYGTIKGNTVTSPFPKTRKLAGAGIGDNNIDTPFFVQVASPQSEAVLKTLISDLLPTHLKNTYTDASSQLESTNVIYSDLIEKLVSGNFNALPDKRPNGEPALKPSLTQAFKGESIVTANRKTLDFQPLKKLYAIQTGNSELDYQLNNANSENFRRQLLGLDLARKIYSEGQEVEWESIALSLAMGGIAEPTVSHLFKDGGPVASAIRTTLLSGVDIMGNVLSVMGVVSEKQKAKGRKLTLESIFGPKKERTFKSYLNPQGEAGPDIKQGIKVGVGGGMFGVLYNVPVGMLLSQPNGDILSRAIVGGLSSTGSAVAIPSVIKSTQEGLKKNIEYLIDVEGQIKAPKDPKERDKFIKKLAMKEMNTRIGYASSIKATNPIPLLGTGAIILGAEKLGIPREYVQTAYMSLAPVMHNFIRLLYTGKEKFYTIPRRLNKLEKLVLSNKQGEITQQQLDNALLDKEGDWMIRFLTNTAGVGFAGIVLLAAELMVFNQAYRKNKAATTNNPNNKPVPSSPPIHFQLQPRPVVGNTLPIANFNVRPTTFQLPYSGNTPYYSGFPSVQPVYPPFYQALVYRPQLNAFPSFTRPVLLPQPTVLSPSVFAQ